jgi:hypothetical protein
VGDAEYRSCACEGLSNLDFVQLNNTIVDIYNCFSIKQAFTNQDNPKRQNSFQSTSCNGDACSSHYYQGSYNKVKQILVAENEYMFGSNVNNKIELQTKYITIVDALRLNWDLIDERQVKQIIRSFPQLNPEIINKIVAYLNKNPDISLDLLGLTDISLNGIEQFEANPGDLVFTPYGVTHEVKSLSPRVSVVIFTKRSETLDAFRSISNNMGKDTQRYV